MGEKQRRDWLSSVMGEKQRCDWLSSVRGVMQRRDLSIVAECCAFAAPISRLLRARAGVASRSGVELRRRVAWSGVGEWREVASTIGVEWRRRVAWSCVDGRRGVALTGGVEWRRREAWNCVEGNPPPCGARSTAETRILTLRKRIYKSSETG